METLLQYGIAGAMPFFGGEYTMVQPYGLTKQQVQERMERGEHNDWKNKAGRTVAEIIRSNLLTYFNLIFTLLALLVFTTGAYKNLTFVPVVLLNSAIGLVQELRAKKALERITLLHTTGVSVIRDGEHCKIPPEELVREDVAEFCGGEQICADAVILDGTVFVNESNITGEQDEIQKKQGDILYSGSYLLSGRCYAQITAVGSHSYVNRISSAAKKQTGAEESPILRSLNKLLRITGIVLVPLGAGLFCQSYFGNHSGYTASVLGVTAAVVGMIPQGLYLLTTMALAAGTVKLSGENVLLHSMKGIETLAGADVLCVDKTGTITEPAMEVAELAAEAGKAELFRQKLNQYVSAAADENETMAALKRFCSACEVLPAVSVRPFTAVKKYGEIQWETELLRLGAPDVARGKLSPGLDEKIHRSMERGCRVLLLEADEEPLGAVILQNSLRPNAAQTFRYLSRQGVAIKILSGDAPLTVSRVAKEAGILQWDSHIDGTLLNTEEKLSAAAEKYTIVGRMAPEQKQQLIRILQKNGHRVAMVGDGINDSPAMAAADCSVAMASGSEAAVQTAKMVLLDRDFARLPSVIDRGRQIINNITRSAALFLAKNIFSFLTALISVLFSLSYPIEPTQLTLVSMFTIGLPGFLLAFEPNDKPISGHFLSAALSGAAPAGIGASLTIALLVLLPRSLEISSEDVSLGATLVLAAVGFGLLFSVCRPLTKYRLGVLGCSLTGFLLAAGIFPELFSLHRPMPGFWAGAGIILAISLLLLFILQEIIRRCLGKRIDKRPEKL